MYQNLKTLYRYGRGQEETPLIWMVVLKWLSKADIIRLETLKTVIAPMEC